MLTSIEILTVLFRKVFIKWTRVSPGSYVPHLSITTYQ